MIYDNSRSSKRVIDYLRAGLGETDSLSIATGYFEIGALFALDGLWQQIQSIRLLIGSDVSLETHEAFQRAFQSISQHFEASVEAAKATDILLQKAADVIQALRSGQITVRLYRQSKFHAKVYLTAQGALVGSSNFTPSGLMHNIELNVDASDRHAELRAWFERHWEAAEDLTPELLRVVERHAQPYAPFELYIRAMQAYFERQPSALSDWERTQSRIYPLLANYQREGYHQLMGIARRYHGALLCDGVGLGKTFIGLMVIERLLYERKRVALLVPRAAREGVWEAKLRQYLPQARGRFSNLVVYNHTDLLRGGDYTEWIAEIAERADAIVIDEAHHFRNIASKRSRRLFEITAGKQLFLLTATPINNSIYDLLHLIEYFSRRQSDYFRALGIHSLRGYFRKIEQQLEQSAESLVDPAAAEKALIEDKLFRALVVQRSRAYVRQSLRQENDDSVQFPQRRDPQVANYSLARTYGTLLDKFESAFSKQKPLLNLAVYNPLAYYKRDPAKLDPFDVGRQAQIVALLRTLLLKRFESSATAFTASCEALLLKLLAFVEVHDRCLAERWRAQHADLLAHIQARRAAQAEADSEEEDDDALPEVALPERLDPRKYDIATIVSETILDLDQLAEFLDMLREFTPEHDDKLQRLLALFRTDPVMQRHKVLLFTEYRETARYLARQLRAAGISDLEVVHGGTRADLSDVVRRFAPYYNGSSSPELRAKGERETRILISTDILAEGLNLQDATCIINYDLHWNPVRLMQRIGRVDRRLDPAIEAAMIADQPELKEVRGTVTLWNFLPPHELNRLLSLYKRVTAKTLLISKIFGIEGRKLLTPEDDYAALRDFNAAYEGNTSPLEQLYLTYQELQRQYPDHFERAAQMPQNAFSAKASEGIRGLFFCYQLPAYDPDQDAWTLEAGSVVWYVYNLESETLEDDPVRIHEFIRSTPQTPYRRRLAAEQLKAIRARLESHVQQTYLRRVQAPIDVKPVLAAWMELC